MYRLRYDINELNWETRNLLKRLRNTFASSNQLVKLWVAYFDKFNSQRPNNNQAKIDDDTLDLIEFFAKSSMPIIEKFRKKKSKTQKPSGLR